MAGKSRATLGSFPSTFFRAQFQFCSLGSGSEGNGLLVGYRNTLVMVDCGFKITEVCNRLARLGLVPTDINAIFVTHEHQDHMGGVGAISRAGNIPIYGSRGTLHSLKAKGTTRIHYCNDGDATQLGDLLIRPFSVPHDASEPLQYVIESSDALTASPSDPFTDTHHSQSPTRLGILTDAGHISVHMIKSLANCQSMYLEFNHDPLMLRHSSYPPKLRGRIAGNYGHLSNQQAVKLLLALPDSKPHTIVAAHLSKKTNHPDKVKEALSDYLAQFATKLIMADQDQGFPWTTVDERQ